MSNRLRETLARKSELTPRLVAFLELLLSTESAWKREDVKKGLFEKGIGSDVGHAGRLLSNLSQFLTKKLNPHLRQVIAFDTGGEEGETKDNYRLLPEYRDLVAAAISEWRAAHPLQSA